VEVASYPPISNGLADDHANLPFSGVAQGVRDLNPEIPGGYIALVATNNNGVQTPPNSLERIHACLQKQVAFNQRILKNEELISGIDVEMAEFLREMSMEAPLLACVNVSGRIRATQRICGDR
jgi:hypothetical protein